MTSCYIAQLSFSFYRHRAIRADFSGGQITSDAGLLPLRAFDQRHGLTQDLAKYLSDLREEERVRHSGLSLFRHRIYQMVAGYEDADADRLRHDPAFQILADQRMATPSAHNLLSGARKMHLPLAAWCALNQALLVQFIRLCGQQVRQRSSFRHRAHSWSRWQRICYTAEHTRSEPTSGSWAPIVRAALPKSLPFTMIAGSTRTASRIQ